MLQLADVRQAVRSNLDDPQYDGSKIDSAINWFQFEIFNNTRTALMETTATLTPSAGDSSVGLPTDLQALTNATVTVPSVYSIWKNKVEAQTFDEYFPGFDTYDPRNLYEWCVYGRLMRFSAPLLSNTTIRIDYVRRPVAASEASPSLEIPDQYFELAVLGAQARVMEVNEDFAEAAQIRNNLDPLLTTFIRNEARGGQTAGPSIMRSNRRRTGGGFGDPAASY